MHGFNHIAWYRRHWFERLLWTLATALAIWGVLDISLGQLRRYNANPTVVALEKDFRNWKFNIPAITSCDHNRVNKKKLPEVIKSFWNITAEHEKYEYYSNFVSTVANSALFNLYDFTKFAGDETLNVDLFKLVFEVMSNSVPRVQWPAPDKHSPVPPKLAWTPVMTELGVCHTINSLAIADIVLQPLTANDTHYYPITCKYSRLSCYILLELPDKKNFHIFVHSNYDIVNIVSAPTRYNVFISSFTTCSIDVIALRDGRGVYDLSPSRRECRYIAEPDKDRKVFSTNTCHLSCRSKLAKKLCGCKPFYYFYEEGELCDVAGMVCLSSKAEDLATNAGKQCVCEQQCVNTFFKESSIQTSVETGFLKDKGNIKLIIQAPQARYTREIIFDFQDLVVSFGGAAGLLLGASFISIVEIFYFFLERFLTLSIGGAIGNGADNPKHVQSKIPPLLNISVHAFGFYHLTHAPGALASPSPRRLNVQEMKQSVLPSYEATRIKELTKILESQTSYDGRRRNTKLY